MNGLCKWVIVGVCVAALLVLGTAMLLRRSGDGTNGRSPKDHLTVGLAGYGEFNTLDPVRVGTAAPAAVIWQIYDRLVDVDPDGKVVPMLANSWESDADLKVWRFHLRQDAKFHRSEAGAPERRVLPGDVCASLERAIRIPGFGQSLLGDLVVGAQEFKSGKTNRLSGIEVAGNDLVIRLERPFAFLPGRLAASFFSIVPEDTPDDPPEPPAGSGPYQLATWDRALQKIVLASNGTYWGQASEDRPRQLTFLAMENANTAVEEIAAGAIDWLEATSSALPLVRAAPLGDEFKVDTIVQTDIRLIALNMTKAPAADHPAIGKALNYATDREALIEALGGGAPVGGPVP